MIPVTPSQPKPMIWATFVPGRNGKSMKYYDNLGHAKNSLYHNGFGQLWKLVDNEWVMILDTSTIEPLPNPHKGYVGGTHQCPECGKDHTSYIPYWDGKSRAIKAALKEIK